MPIPKLAAGELPVGVHIATLEEVKNYFGKGNNQRKRLMSGLAKAATMFKKAGVKFIYVDGSFTTDKEEPNDIDGCWSVVGPIDLLAIDSDFWDFDEKTVHAKRNSIKAKYGLDFFFAEFIEGASGKPFPEFFQINRDGYRKGIIKIILN